MVIKQFLFKNLHGHISGELQFHSGENFIVGINGCGKTTVLNFMKYMLSPSFPDLFTTYHETAQIQFVHAEKLYTLTSTMKEDDNKNDIHEYTIWGEELGFHPIVTRLAMNPRSILNSSKRNELYMHYRTYSPSPEEMDTWKFLNGEVPEPVFVGLDREFGNISIRDMQERERMEFERHREPSGRTRSIDAIVRDAFNSYKSERIKLNTKLNADIVGASFGSIISHEVLDFGETPSTEVDLDKIENLEKKIRQFGDPKSSLYIETFGTKTVRDSAAKFIAALKSLVKEGEEDRLLYLLNSQQFERIASMLELFENYEQDILEKKERVNVFVSNVSKFLEDSGKRIEFNEDTGDLYFLLPNDAKRLVISDLSSGERQIVILFAYFAFSSLEGQPIIVDEPELSLHVHWQSMFMEAVKDLLPSNSQAIMATHSPDICGGENVNMQVMRVNR